MKLKTCLAILAAVAVVMAVAACTTANSADFGKADGFTNASQAYFYEDYALKGDDLMNAINSFSGFYLLATTNPDGTPQAGYYLYGCLKLDDEYYIQLGLADNQGRENLTANEKAVAVYAAAPDEMPYAMSGARMDLELVTDEETLAALGADEAGVIQFGHIVATYPLG